jgi:hypothetical protein
VSSATRWRATGPPAPEPERPSPDAIPVTCFWMLLFMEPMWPRSLVSVAIATDQPSCSGPSSESAGMRTSSRNTSSNSEPPVICRNGRTSTPGLAIGTRKNEMPLCFGASATERVRARQIPQSATRPLEHHTFWPWSTQESPSGTAEVDNDARSDPAPGSLKSWHQTRVPSASPGRWAASWEGVP